ncbi:MAG: SDR family NAD(P)-dependent oxidoreductase [bacterium]
MKKAIITGASSGIGMELARVLSENGYILGLAARRKELLENLSGKLPNQSYVREMDVTKPKDAVKGFRELVKQLGGLDLVVINAGMSITNYDLDPKPEQQMIDVNVSGFVTIAIEAVKFFEKQESGHIVGISSIAALRGNDRAPAYNASKAFVSNYMDGLRKKMERAAHSIAVTDIQPGFVDTPMIEGKTAFWVAPARKAAQQIFRAIKKRKKHAYITTRWRLIAWLLKLLPDTIYNKV